eukprot:74723_1
MKILFSIHIILALYVILWPTTVLSQVDCSCGTTIADWQCTDNSGSTYVGGTDGFTDCIDERDDIWEGETDCKYCYKCTDGSGLGTCECDNASNCSDVFLIVGIILIILGIIFLIWQ